MTVNIWKISGYMGWSDYDGPQDDNVNFIVAMDSRFKKEDVEEIFVNRYSKSEKNRVVVISATLIDEGKEIDWRSMEKER